MHLKFYYKPINVQRIEKKPNFTTRPRYGRGMRQKLAQFRYYRAALKLGPGFRIVYGFYYIVYIIECGIRFDIFLIRAAVSTAKKKTQRPDSVIYIPHFDGLIYPLRSSRRPRQFIYQSHSSLLYCS